MNHSSEAKRNRSVNHQENCGFLMDNTSLLLKRSTIASIEMCSKAKDTVEKSSDVNIQRVCNTRLSPISWDSSSLGNNEGIDDCSLLSQCQSLLFDDVDVSDNENCDCETTISMLEEDDDDDDDNDELALLFTSNNLQQERVINEDNGDRNASVVSPTCFNSSVSSSVVEDTPMVDGDLVPTMSSVGKSIKPLSSAKSGSFVSPVHSSKSFSYTLSIHTHNYASSNTMQYSRNAHGKDFFTSLCMPEDMCFSITSFLDIVSLLNLRGCSRRMCSMASRDEAGWRSRCLELWSTKIHVSSKARILLEEPKNGVHCNAMKAYKLSLLDSSHRNEITTEELCFDPSRDQNVVWSFRFKESAGPDWTSWDPWWNGREAKQMVFLEDGSVVELSPSSPFIKPEQQERREEPFLGQANFALRASLSNANNEPVQQQHTSETSTIAMSAQSNSSSNNDRTPNNAGLRIKMRWRFIDQPMDLPPRHRGSYIRLTIGGRDVPTYVVRRSPTGNWGFVLESCWGLYASFNLPHRNSYAMVVTNNTRERYNRATTIRDDMAPRQKTRMKIRRTPNGARWINVGDIESDDDESDRKEENFDTNTQRRQENSGLSEGILLDDASLTVTNFSQWREALLYNHGAMTLPHGRGATEEFDRVWRNAVNIQTIRNDDHLTDSSAQR